MDNQDKIEALIGRIAEGKHTNTDLSQLRDLLSSRLSGSNSESLIQLGKNIVGRIDGQHIHIGDRIYYQWNKEAIEALVKAIQKARRDPKSLLIKAIKNQVETRLESSLHNRVYIIPTQDKNPNQVEHPWSIDVKSGSKPKVRLPSNTHIITVFDQEGINGRLLILGQPGTGKTTMLLELAKKLVERAEENLNEPIPVLFSLSAWRDNHQSIEDWLVAELTSIKYRVPRYLAKQWLKNQDIIPLLDGLDELTSERQEICVLKLNAFLQPGNWSNPVVVGSRIKEYQIYSTRLALNNSVELQPFTSEQIQDYLTCTDNNYLGDIFRDNPEFMELAQTPLFLNIIVLSRQKISLEEWQKLNSLEERINYLFSVYVEEMLERKYVGKHHNYKQTKRWLRWLAIKLIEQKETEFFIEKIQPTWLENRRDERTYRLILGLSFGLIIGLIIQLITSLIIGLIGSLSFGLKEGLSFGLIFWLILGLILGSITLLIYSLIPGLIGSLIFWLMGGLMGGLTKAITTSEILQFNWKKFWQKGRRSCLIFGLYPGLIIGLVIGLAGVQEFGLIIGLIGGLIFGPILGLIPGLIIGLIVGLIGGIERSDIKTKTSPNQGIWKSLQNALIIGLIGVLIGGLMGGLIGMLTSEPIGGLGWGIIGGLFVGLSNGGNACIKHFSLRFTLYRNGHIPWNYAGFLNYATDRVFLQRVGGSYRFMHDLLRQHFAENYQELD
jgi:GTPase SAR1 family protein